MEILFGNEDDVVARDHHHHELHGQIHACDDEHDDEHKTNFQKGKSKILQALLIIWTNCTCVESVVSIIAWANGNIMYYYLSEFEAISVHFKDHGLPKGEKFHDFVNHVGTPEQAASEDAFMNDVSKWSVVAGYWQWVHFCYILMVVLSAVKIILFGFLGTELFSKMFKFFHQAAIITMVVFKT